MNSKEIYLGIKELLNSLEWCIKENQEWEYVGEDHDNSIKIRKIHMAILSSFNSEEFYINLGPRKSKKINWKDAEAEIFPRLGKEGFHIANLEFDTLLEFHQVGIMRKGELKKVPR